MSGASLRSSRPTRSQLNGLQEFRRRVMRNPSGAGSEVYCVLPGKRKDGYWSVKVQTSTSCPSAANCLARRSLNVANPPL